MDGASESESEHFESEDVDNSIISAEASVELQLGIQVAALPKVLLATAVASVILLFSYMAFLAFD